MCFVHTRFWIIEFTLSVYHGKYFNKKTTTHFCLFLISKYEKVSLSFDILNIGKLFKKQQKQINNKNVSKNCITVSKKHSLGKNRATLSLPQKKRKGLKRHNNNNNSVCFRDLFVLIQIFKIGISKDHQNQS